MGDIDIGMTPSDFGQTLPANAMHINLQNPANDTGTIDTFQCYFRANGTNVKIGCLTHTGSNYLIETDHENLGSVTAGSVQTFSGLNCDVESGDYIGVHADAGGCAYQSSGGIGMWYHTSADYFDGSSHLYTYIGSQYRIAIYGEGSTPSIQKLFGVV